MAWDSKISIYGSLKGNKLEAKNYIKDYNPSYNAASAALFARMVSAGETPTDLRKAAINTAIVALKAAGLFETQFDIFVVTKGYGLASTKLNWIGNSFNAVASGSPIFTENIGYNSGEGSGYLINNYNISSNSVLYKRDDACFGFMIDMDGEIGATGAWITPNTGLFMSNAGTSINNATYSSDSFGVVKSGYNCLSRNNGANYNIYKTSTQKAITAASAALVNTSLQIGYLASAGSLNGNIGLYYIGKNISYANHLVLQTIMNAYFASI